MAESSTNSEKNFFKIRSTLSNEHLVFAETLRDWNDPLLQGQQPIPALLCPRCTTCKCESLKDFPTISSHSHHKHDPSCPNFHQNIIKSKRRAISHDPLITFLNTSSSSSSAITSKSAEYSSSKKQKNFISKIPIRISTPINNYSPIKIRSSNNKTKIPRFIRTRNVPSPIKPTTTDNSYEIDSLNGDVHEESLTMSANADISSTKNNQLDSMNEQILTKKKKKRHTHNTSSLSSDKQQRPRYRSKEGRHSKSKQTTNDLSSSSSSSNVPLRKKSRSYRVPSPSSQVFSLFSDDSLSEKSRRYSSIGLTKTISNVWKNTTSKIHEEENQFFFSRYSVEKISPVKNSKKSSIPISSRNIILQRSQIDSWQNFPTTTDSIITSSCHNSTGSASHLLSSSSDSKQNDIQTNSNGHIISITTTKCHQPSLLNKIQNIQWNIEGNGKQLRYSKVKWHSDNQLHKHKRLTKEYLTDCSTDTGSSSEQATRSVPLTLHHENNTNVSNELQPENLPMDTNSKPIDSTSFHLTTNKLSSSKPKQISYASTDEDVDELSSHYSEDIDQSLTTIQHYREKLQTRLLSSTNEHSENDSNPIVPSMILSTEYSQITFDSGVDINSEQKIYQPNTTLTIDEQSSEEITDQNDLFALSDDSLIEIPPQSPTNDVLLDQSITEDSELTLSITKTEQDTYFSATSELTNEKDPYGGYELETISDDDDHYHPVQDESNELILTTEATSVPPPIPSQYEFKLPSFGEWIDRVFTTFLSETNPNPLASKSSSRSSSITSINHSQTTNNTSSVSHITAVFNNQNLPNSSNVDLQQTSSWPREEEQDDDHSLNDMSSSSLNSEKVDFDTYIINSNYEKINPSGTNEQNEIPFINERSKSSLLSSITSSIENDDQEVMNNEGMQNDDDNFSKQITNTDEFSSFPITEQCRYSSNSHDSLLQSDHHIDTATSSTDDLTRTNRLLTSIFHSKDSALDLSEDNQSSQQILQNKTFDNSEITINTYDKSPKNTMIYLNEHEKDTERTISSSSSEQLIPKEKQTGMYYKAFGSSAALHLAEQYRCEWLPEIPDSILIEKPSELDDTHLRIVHQSQIIGDNEDEFYFSPQTLHSSYSCPNLNINSVEFLLHERSYSLSALDAYKHLNITHETLEHIWLSLLDVAFSDRDDYELNEYKLRHIRGLSTSYSNMNQSVIEKSRSHNDIFTIINANNQKLITKNKSKSFDITSLIKPTSSITNDLANIGLLQGADISEPFANCLISTSIHSDLESMHSLEQERELPPPPSSPPIKESLNFVFNLSHQTDIEDLNFESLFDTEDQLLDASISFNNDDSPPPIVPIQNTYVELSLFHPHSLSTIPSSRASQYASSVDSDDLYEREHHLIKETLDEINQYHISDDDHGVIGSEFSSPQSRPLSSIQSRPISPEQNQNFEYSDHLISIIPLEPSDPSPSYFTDKIEPILFFNKNHEENFDSNHFIEQIDQNILYPLIHQDYLTIEQDSNIYLDPNELVHRLTKLDSSNQTSINKQDETINHQLIDNETQNSTPTVDQIHPTENLLSKQHPSTISKPPIHYQNQRIDKVSDLEIVKQGKGFKIGYVDRQGTDQRVILTKRIEAGPDIIERDPHTRLPYKGQRILNQIFSSVLYTNGYNSFQEDEKFQHLSEDFEVPIIGTNPKHFDESDMISIDIDGPSTMLNSICESIVITQGSVYSKPQPISDVSANQHEEYLLQTSHLLKKDKIEVIDRWHDQTIINGSSTPWRSPMKPSKNTQSSSVEQLPLDSNKQQKTTRDIALSPILLPSEKHHQTTSTSPITIDNSCQYSPSRSHDQGVQCSLERITSHTQVSSYELPGLLKTHNGIQTSDNSAFRQMITHPRTLERCADSGILVDDNHRIKSNLSLQIDRRSSSSDSDDISEVTKRPFIRQTLLNMNNLYEHSTRNHSDVNIPTHEMDQEISQLRRERSHVLDLLSLNWNRSNIWVELTEAKLNYIIGETDALLRSLSFDPTPMDNETVKQKMHQYEEDMTELSRQHLEVYRKRLEDSKKQLDRKIDELELRKSSLENHSLNRLTTLDHSSRSLNTKRSKSFLSTSAENLTYIPIQDTIASHPHLLDVSFLTSKPNEFSSRFVDPHINTNETIHRPTPRYPTSNNHPTMINNGNLANMEGLSKSQQAILDETDELVKDSQQLHTESASQFERARESLLSSETSIRLARANMAASRSLLYSEKKNYLPNDVTLAELFKYEQLLAKEATKTNTRRIYSSTKTTTES